MTERERFLAWRRPRQSFQLYWDKCVERGAIWAGADATFAVDLAINEAVTSGALNISNAQARKLINYLQDSLAYAAKHYSEQA